MNPVAPYSLPAQGGALPLDYPVDSLAAAATQQGVLLATADCDRARSRSAVLRAIARAVDAAVLFGSDLDRLFDGLCEAIDEQKTGLILWLQHLHSGDPALTDDATRIEAVCQDASGQNLSLPHHPRRQTPRSRTGQRNSLERGGEVGNVSASPPAKARNTTRAKQARLGALPCAPRQQSPHHVSGVWRA